jgi:uncharacterized protein YneR
MKRFYSILLIFLISLSGFSQQEYTGGINVPTGFSVKASVPVDDRTVVNDSLDLINLPNKYEGIIVYVKEDKVPYFYDGSVWKRTTNSSADRISYSNSTSGLDSNYVQGAIDEIVDRIENLPSPVSNTDLTLIIDENNVIWSNITTHEEEFTANGTNREFQSDFNFATIDRVFINGVRIKRNDYLVVSESEIEIKETVTLLENDSVTIEGTIFINEN